MDDTSSRIGQITRAYLALEARLVEGRRDGTIPEGGGPEEDAILDSMDDLWYAALRIDPQVWSRLGRALANQSMPAPLDAQEVDGLALWHHPEEDGE